MKNNEMIIRADAKAMGAVTALTVAANPRWTPTPKASRFTDTIIDGITVPAAVVGNVVKVTYADGRNEYRSQSSFRSKHISTRNTRHKSNAREINARITAADLAPIGNVE